MLLAVPCSVHSKSYNAARGAAEEEQDKEGLRLAAVGSQHVQRAETRQKLLKRGSDKLNAAQQAVWQEEGTALARENIMRL